MRTSTLRLLAAAAAGVLFGAGLVVSQMTSPAKVLAFLDVAGAWDPSLALVMGGALLVAVPAYRHILGRGQPLFDTRFHLPGARGVDVRLLTGAAIFGIGWGIAGFCPGPAVAALVSGQADPWLFVFGLLIGSWVTGRLSTLRPAAQPGR
jgi:uncharacterized membrane protein YedE/YeeE